MEKAVVLVIDDEVEIANEIGQIIKEGGFKTEVVNSGEEGLEKMKKMAIDVVLLDIKMPKMWGTEVLREIKKLSRLVEVIMLSILDDAKSAWTSSEYGAFDYITKPFKSDDLLFRVQIAAKRVEKKRNLFGSNRSTELYFKLHDEYPAEYDRVIREFEKKAGEFKLMDFEEVKKWFSEDKLRSIFGSDFQEEWLKG